MKTNQTQTLTKPNTKKGEYKLTYKQHNILKQAAYQIMQNHNTKQYNSNNKNKTYLKYTQTVAILYKTKTTNQLLDIIEQYLNSKEKQQNIKLTEHNQSQIITSQLKDLGATQIEQITTRLQQLEQKYLLQLDTDYTNKQSILESWQQVLAYKQYHIQLQLRETEEEPYYEEQSYDLEDLLESHPELHIWNPEERSN